MPMGFTRDPGPLPFVTVRDYDKWAPKLANGQIEIVSESPELAMPLQMVRVARTEEITAKECAERGLYTPGVYLGRRLLAVHLEALDA